MADGKSLKIMVLERQSGLLRILVILSEHGGDKLPAVYRCHEKSFLNTLL